MGKMETMSYQEMLAEHAQKAAEARAKAETSPYKSMFQAAVEAPDTGGGGTCLRLLLSLYDGARFKVDLTDLRRLDAGLHAAAIAAMRDEIGSAHYVNDRIATETGFNAAEIASKLEWLAYKLGVPGRVKKDRLPTKPGHFDFGLTK